MSHEPGSFERAAARAGFKIEHFDVIGLEWPEAREEDGSGQMCRQLIHAARLIRCDHKRRAELGRVGYRVEGGNALWDVYQTIGELQPRVFVPRRLVAIWCPGSAYQH